MLFGLKIFVFEFIFVMISRRVVKIKKLFVIVLLLEEVIVVVVLYC